MTTLGDSDLREPDDDGREPATSRRRATLGFNALRLSVLVALVAAAAAPLLLARHFHAGNIGIVVEVISKTFVLFLFPALIYLLLIGVLGRSLGITNLFWHDEPRTRQSAAAAVVFSLAVVSTLMFLSWMIDPDTPAPRNLDRFSAFLLAFFFPAVPLVLAPAAFPGQALFAYVPRSACRGPSGAPGRDVTRSAAAWCSGFATWLTGVVAGLGLSIAFFAGMMILFHFILAMSLGRPERLKPVASPIYLSFTALSLISFLVAAFRKRTYNKYSPPVAICALVVLIAFAYAWIEDLPELALTVLFGKQAGMWVPLARAVVFVALLGLYGHLNQDPFQLRFPNMDGEYRSRIPLVLRVKGSYIARNHVVRWRPQPDDGCELHLGGPPEDPAHLRTGGPDQMFLSGEGDRLRLWLFDALGAAVKDDRGREIRGIEPPSSAEEGAVRRLRERVEGFPPGRGPDEVERHRIIAAARSIFGLPAPGSLEARLAPDIDALENWLRRVTGEEPVEVKGWPEGRRPKLAVVAVSGGATRSAFWTAEVLRRLDAKISHARDRMRCFRDGVRIITGASGGMLGAAYFVKACRDRLEGTPPSIGSPALPADWVTWIPTDSLGPVARFIALRDPWLALVPGVRAVLGGGDRGIELEEVWKAHGLSHRMQDLLEGEERGEIPSIILSPMMIEDGRRLLISNLDLRDMTVVQGSALTFEDLGFHEYPYSLSALEFFRLFPEAKDFALRTGIRMSASFPYISPAVNLPTDPPRRVVDAGYYDNYGVQVATAWIQKNRVWLRAHTSGVVLIQIRDAISQKARLEIADAPAGFLAWLARGFRFFTSPIDGAAAARSASTLFRNDQDVWELSDLFDRDDPLRPRADRDDPRRLDRAFFTTVVFENSAAVTLERPAPGSWPGERLNDWRSGDVALDWYVSDAEREGLADAIPPDPAADSPWHDPQARRDHIRRLNQKVDETSGSERDEYLKYLEQVKNYERLAILERWWNAGREPPSDGNPAPPGQLDPERDQPHPGGHANEPHLQVIPARDHVVGGIERDHQVEEAVEEILGERPVGPDAESHQDQGAADDHQGAGRGERGE